VFARQGPWEENIDWRGQTREDQPLKTLRSLPISWFARYLLYLIHVLGLSEIELCEILLEGPRQIYRYQEQVKKELQNVAAKEYG
jgi:hypothetical protein